MSEWRITIRVWPHSGGSESDVGGEYLQYTTSDADNFKMACRFADAFLMGIRTNPKVWQANIVSVEMVR